MKPFLGVKSTHDVVRHINLILAPSQEAAHKLLMKAFPAGADTAVAYSTYGLSEPSEEAERLLDSVGLGMSLIYKPVRRFTVEIEVDEKYDGDDVMRMAAHPELKVLVAKVVE